MRTTRQLSITLPNEMADVLRERVRSGEYASESEVIREGLRALFARDQAIESWLRDEAPGGAGTAGRRASRERVSLGVVFTPEVEDQFVELYRYIAAAGSAEVATTSGQVSARSASGDGSLSHSPCWTRPWRSLASSTAGAITRRF